MKKFLSIIGLTGIMLFAGNAAYAVEEAPGPHDNCLTDPSVCVMAEDGSLVNRSFYPQEPVTQCGDVTESGVIVGDNAAGCMPVEDCPRGPDGECYSEAVPNPEHVETFPSPETVPAPETVEPSAAPVETPALSTEPVRSELAYTGAEDVLLATVGAAVTLAGVVLVRHSLKMRRKAAGYSV